MSDGPIRIDGIDYSAEELRAKVRSADDFEDHDDYFHSRFVYLGLVLIVLGGGAGVAALL